MQNMHFFMLILWEKEQLDLTSLLMVCRSGDRWIFHLYSLQNWTIFSFFQDVCPVLGYIHPWLLHWHHELDGKRERFKITLLLNLMDILCNYHHLFSQSLHYWSTPSQKYFIKITKKRLSGWISNEGWLIYWLPESSHLIIVICLLSHMNHLQKCECG